MLRSVRITATAAAEDTMRPVETSQGWGEKVAQWRPIRFTRLLQAQATTQRCSRSSGSLRQRRRCRPDWESRIRAPNHNTVSENRDGSSVVGTMEILPVRPALLSF